uniref:Phospholipase A2 inhibitor gamma subunit B-like n=1 Tax=Pogona vitticeps TaxID=103695 RepID=A0ABM5ERW5_9SAUR
MHLLALGLLLPLLAPGDAISCFNCTSTEGYNCSTSQQKCTASVNSCITIARNGNTGGLDIQHPTYEKKCNSDDRLCNQFYGLVAGDFRMLWNSSCCRADRCNTQEVIVQTAPQIPNGVRCNSCFARGANFCLNHTTVACIGLLTNCIHFATIASTDEFKDEQVAFTGCATRNMCDMGAGALFAAGRNVDIKVNTCSRALGISTQYSLVLPLLAGLLCFAFCS